MNLVAWEDIDNTTNLTQIPMGVCVFLFLYRFNKIQPCLPYRVGLVALGLTKGSNNNNNANYYNNCQAECRMLRHEGSQSEHDLMIRQQVDDVAPTTTEITTTLCLTRKRD